MWKKKTQKPMAHKCAAMRKKQNPIAESPFIKIANKFGGRTWYGGKAINAIGQNAS